MAEPDEEEGPLSMTSSMSAANLTINPFETASLDSMHLPAFSPSVFKQSQNTPCSKKKNGFRWSIDQMSMLFPADIDELPQQQETSLLSKEKEEQVQEAINQFFSQKDVVPSPWSHCKPMKQVTFSPKPPSVSVLSDHSAENSVCSSTNGSFLGSLSGKVDVSCQTALTIPLNFDLEALLGKGRFIYTKSSVESFPVAPLRRKLFTQSESSSNGGGPSASPLSLTSSRESGPFSPSISPIKSSQESSPPERGCIPYTPNSMESQFSSSPIAHHKATPGRLTPRIRHQASPLCGSMESPSMSPISEVNQHSSMNGAPPSPITGSPNTSETGFDHISPYHGHSSSVGQHPISSEHMIHTSLLKHSPPIFKPHMADIGGGQDGRGEDEDDDDGEIEGRKDFTLGLTRELSPIQKIGDQILTLDEPGCSSRLHGTQEESIMDTSLLSNKGELHESLQACPASPPQRHNIPCDFSLEASTVLSPIPKTGDLQLHHQEVPVTPYRAKAGDGIDNHSRPHKGRHKMVSFHIGTDFSPIRCPESSADQNSCQTVPITSSRVHESNTDILMETSLFSVDDTDREGSGAFDDVDGDVNVVMKSTSTRESANEIDDVSDERFNIVRASSRRSDHCSPTSRFGIEGSGQSGIEDGPMGMKQNVGAVSPGCDIHSHVKFSPAQFEPKDDGQSSMASKQHSESISATPRGREVVESACRSSECRSCDHGSACWVADSNLSSVNAKGSNWPHLQGMASAANCLTSTMRYGTPSNRPQFQYARKNEGAITSLMDLSLVSMIASDAETQQSSHNPVRSPDMLATRLHSKFSENSRVDKVKFEEKAEEHVLQTSFSKVGPGFMRTSRSYDSLRKFAEEKGMDHEEDDWLMTSFSENDLQGSRTSTELHDRVACKGSPDVHVPSVSIKQHNELQQGSNSYFVFQGAQPKLHSYRELEMQKGPMSENQQKRQLITGMEQGDDISADLQKGHCVREVQEGIMSGEGHQRELSPVRPLSVDLLSHCIRSGIDSGYNTNSATVSMEVADIYATP